MKKISVIFLAASVSACGSLHLQSPPDDVATIPNDCANLSSISNWLESRAQQPKTTFQSTENYQQAQSNVKHKLWTLRYNCNPV